MAPAKSTAKNKNLFGKIIGVEDETPTVIEEEFDIEELVDEENYTDDAEEVTPEETATEIEIAPEESEAQPVQTTAASKSEEWMSDYEGALNIDMYQTRDNVIIKSTIAGVRPADLDITVANDMVSIKGSRKKEETISEDDYFYQECYWGGFSRSVIVPVDIDSENIEADLKDGILTIIIPKAAKAKTKKIRVKG